MEADWELGDGQLSACMHPGVQGPRKFSPQAVPLSLQQDRNISAHLWHYLQVLSQVLSTSFVVCCYLYAQVPALPCSQRLLKSSSSLGLNCIQSPWVSGETTFSTSSYFDRVSNPVGKISGSEVDCLSGSEVDCLGLDPSSTTFQLYDCGRLS